MTERDRLEWWLGDPGDPITLLEGFLATHHLYAEELARTRAPTDRDASHGAVVYLSAAASAAAIGAPHGAPTPVPAVPDLVCVVYDGLGAGRDASADGDAPARRAFEGPAPAGPAGAGRDEGAAGSFALGEWRPSWSAAAHAAAVRDVRAAIARGDVYQVNVVGHAAAPYRGDPTAALRRVATLPGAAYGGVLSGAGWAIASASPETLVDVVAGRAVTRPIKGTRPATAAGHRELLASAKERAEHIMIVDLERNDLARVARTGSVRVDRLYAVRRWCDLWQAESEISAELAPGLGLAALLRAVCPGGSVTGAPKLAALARIAQAEPVGRGPSMGMLGWVGPDTVRLGLSIRTVALDADRAHLWAGGGVTWDSDPAAEVAEAAAKSGPLRAALAGTSGVAEHGGEQHLIDVE